MQIDFYVDAMHLDGLTGARVFAELVLSVFESTMHELASRPFTQDENDIVSAPLPVPVFPGNYESAAGEFDTH